MAYLSKPVDIGNQCPTPYILCSEGGPHHTVSINQRYLAGTRRYAYTACHKFSAPIYLFTLAFAPCAPVSGFRMGATEFLVRGIMHLVGLEWLRREQDKYRDACCIDCVGSLFKEMIYSNTVRRCNTGSTIVFGIAFPGSRLGLTTVIWNHFISAQPLADLGERVDTSSVPAC